MANTEFVIERYELKYRIPPELVAPIRQAIRPYCRLDSASAAGPYLISSLYLDTPAHDFYHHTRDGVPRRFKLRIRRYTTGPYFLECKRRVKDVIAKSRVAIPASAWPEILLRPGGERFVRSEGDRRRLADFQERMHRWGAEPATVVRYAREAHVSEVDDYARVTFDHHLCGHAPMGWHVPMTEPGWLPLDMPERYGLPVSGVVLELKCTSSVPFWMVDIVRRFGLVRQGFSKFCAALEGVLELDRAGDRLRSPSPWMTRRAPA